MLAETSAEEVAEGADDEVDERGEEDCSEVEGQVSYERSHGQRTAAEDEMRLKVGVGRDWINTEICLKIIWCMNEEVGNVWHALGCRLKLWVGIWPGRPESSPIVADLDGSINKLIGHGFMVHDLDWSDRPELLTYMYPFAHSI